MKERSTWVEELKKVKQCVQRQDSTTEQLKDLYYIANRFGFYDAADYLRQFVFPNERQEPETCINCGSDKDMNGEDWLCDGCWGANDYQ